jgi:hypothetical protein
MINLLQSLLGLSAGALIGYGFGLIQHAARQRNERRQAEGKLNSGWAVMPGSGRRVAYLLIMLAGLQFVCPLLFNDGVQWWVSGGVAAGYGFQLLRELRLRMAKARAEA